jgi:DNA-binding NarL/FixJ family response regulator
MRRIALFTDEPVMAAGVTFLLSAEMDFLVAGVWSDTASLAYFVSREKPEVLLADLENGISLPLISDILRAAPGCKIVCWVRSLPVDTALRLLELGVAGIVSKKIAGDLIAGTLRRVADGEQCVDETLFTPSLKPHSLKLTGRESQILSLVALGMRNREMASALSISEGTLKVYVSRLLQKTGLRDRRQLALFRMNNPDAASNAPPANGSNDFYAIPRGSGRTTPWPQSVHLDRHTG